VKFLRGEKRGESAVRVPAGDQEKRQLGFGADTVWKTGVVGLVKQTFFGSGSGQAETGRRKRKKGTGQNQGKRESRAFYEVQPVSFKVEREKGVRKKTTGGEKL